jgi:pimeloyl-ACP methyl ester carboxylesterase
MSRTRIAILAQALVLLLVGPAKAAPVPVDWSGATLPANVRERGLSVAGLETRMLSAGPRSGAEAVVFVNGFPGSSLDFVDLLSTAGHFGRAVAFDLPGFGDAPEPPGYDYSPANQAAFIDAALHRLGISRVHLVMHDFGGFYGLEWASAHRSRMRSVTLFDTGVLEGYAGHPYAIVSGLPGVGELFNATLPEPAFRATVDYPLGNPKPLPKSFLDHLYADFDRHRAAAPLLYRELGLDFFAMTARQKAALAGIRIPALVIWGAHDQYLPASLAARQREIFPRAEVHVFDDAGHFPFVDDVKRTRTLFREFIRDAIG